MTKSAFSLVHGAWHVPGHWVRVPPLPNIATLPVHVLTFMSFTLTGLYQAYLMSSDLTLPHACKLVSNLICAQELSDVVMPLFEHE